MIVDKFNEFSPDTYVIALDNSRDYYMVCTRSRLKVLLKLNALNDFNIYKMVENDRTGFFAWDMVYET